MRQDLLIDRSIIVEIYNAFFNSDNFVLLKNYFTEHECSYDQNSIIYSYCLK